jgi:hypothetical protein
VGLEDSKETWCLCVRSRSVVREASITAQYIVLRNYFSNKFTEYQIQLMSEAGFSGFELHDQLATDGWECMVTPPHTVTEERV